MTQPIATRLVQKLRVFLLLLGVSSLHAQSDSVSFSRDIRPILSGKCFKCHGPDRETREAEFRLDQREPISLCQVIPTRAGSWMW